MQHRVRFSAFEQIEHFLRRLTVDGNIFDLIDRAELVKLRFSRLCPLDNSDPDALHILVIILAQRRILIEHAEHRICSPIALSGKIIDLRKLVAVPNVAH